MKIVYYLMTHKDKPQIKRLLRHLLSSSESLALIHHDAKSAPLTLRTQENLWILDNPVEVDWGRISQVRAMWAGIEWLKQQRVAFDWLIFLSGQDYPTRPVAKIAAELAQTDMDAFVHHERIHENPAHDTRPFQAVCRQRYFFQRVKVPGIRPWYIKRKHPYRNGTGCYAGSSWLNLSHKAVNYLWEQRGLVDELMHYLHRQVCPDETLFQTVLMTNSDLAVANTDRRFIIWRDDASHPETLESRHFDQIRASEAWFARKVDSQVSADLLEQLDHLIAAQSAANSTPPAGGTARSSG